MKEKLKALFIILFLSLNSFGQIVDKKYIDSWVKETYITPEITDSTLYLLNGSIFYADELNKQLSNLEPNDISSINYIKKRFISKVYCVRDHGAIMIRTFSFKNFSDKYLKKDFREFKKKLKISGSNSQKKIPSVIINTILIDNKFVKTEIDKIKPKSILEINTIDVPVNEKKYGENGKNGLIIIYIEKPVANTVYN